MKTIQEREHIYTIENFWSAQHCEDYIAKAENIGYEPATILTANGPRLVDSVRNNSRVLYKDIALAGELWSTLESLAPKTIGNNVAIGLNELFRFYKYQPGQQFRRHRDNSYIRNLYEVSFFTFMIYLNDNFTGGATVFEDLIVKPKQGSALIILPPLATRRRYSIGRNKIRSSYRYHVSLNTRIKIITQKDCAMETDLCIEL